MSLIGRWACVSLENWPLAGLGTLGNCAFVRTNAKGPLRITFSYFVTEDLYYYLACLKPHFAPLFTHLFLLLAQPTLISWACYNSFPRRHQYPSPPHSHWLSKAHKLIMMGESGRSTPIFSMSKTTFSWPLNFSNPLPHKYRAHKLRSKLRARQSPASSIASVQTSFSPFITLRALKAHKWSIYDAQYLFLIALGIFTLSISPSPSPLLKTGAVALLVAALLVPVTSQFFFPFLPILTWLVFFFSCR